MLRDEREDGLQAPGLPVHSVAPFTRAACEQNSVAVSLQEDRASLTLSGGPTTTLHFDLSKVPAAEATSRLQALTLALAERVCSAERRLTGRRGRGTHSN